MRPKYPQVSGRQLIKAFSKLGFKEVRQRGSHVVMRKGSTGCVIPLHDPIKLGTLTGVLKQAGISLVDLQEYL